MSNPAHPSATETLAAAIHKSDSSRLPPFLQSSVSIRAWPSFWLQSGSLPSCPGLGPGFPNNNSSEDLRMASHSTNSTNFSPHHLRHSLPAIHIDSNPTHPPSAQPSVLPFQGLGEARSLFSTLRSLPPYSPSPPRYNAAKVGLDACPSSPPVLPFSPFSSVIPQESLRKSWAKEEKEEVETGGGFPSIRGRKKELRDIIRSEE